MRHSEHYTPWHGHITVLTIAPAWRRLGHARRLTESLERVSDINDAWFVDLYVRAGNKVAVGMYRGMGYVSLVLLTLIYIYVFTFFFIVFVISCFFKLQANISRFLQVLSLPTGGKLLQRRSYGTLRGRRGCVRYAKTVGPG